MVLYFIVIYRCQTDVRSLAVFIRPLELFLTPETKKSWSSRGNFSRTMLPKFRRKMMMNCLGDYFVTLVDVEDARSFIKLSDAKLNG